MRKKVKATYLIFKFSLHNHKQILNKMWWVIAFCFGLLEFVCFWS